MYFWNSKKLREDHVKGPIPASEVLKYLLVSMVFMLFTHVMLGSFAMFPELTGMAPLHQPFQDAVRLLLWIFVVLYLYNVNGGAQGKHLLSRGISILFVLSIKIGVLWGLIAGIGSGVATRIYGQEVVMGFLQSNLFQFSGAAIATLIFAWRAGVHFRYIVEKAQ